MGGTERASTNAAPPDETVFDPSDDLPSSTETQRLLLLLREPERLIESVEEHISISRYHLQRSVTLSLASDVDETDPQPFLLDLLHPDKGVIVSLRLDDAQPVEMLSHQEHVVTSMQLIFFRLLTVAYSATGISDPAGFVGRLGNDLRLIPSLSVEDARSILYKHFDRQGLLLAPPPGFSCDPVKLRGLFVLCKRLCDKYLLLARVTPRGNRGHQKVRFSMHSPISQELTSTSSWWERFGHPVRRHLWYATTPTTFRIHIPWAKRTHHYTLTFDPPGGMFVGWNAILSGETDKAGVPTLLQRDSEYPWSINAQQGRQSLVHLRTARKSDFPFYFGCTIRELPGRSTFQMAALSLVSTALMVLGYFFARVLGEQSSTLATLVLAFFAISTINAPGHASSSPMDAPILSRICPVGVSLSAIAFLAWMLSLKMRYQVPSNPSTFEGIVAAVIGIWHDYGALIPVGISGMLFFLLNSRRRSLLGLYQEVRDAPPQWGGPVEVTLASVKGNS